MALDAKNTSCKEKIITTVKAANFSYFLILFILSIFKLKAFLKEISHFIRWNKNANEQICEIHIQIRSRETV